jgi:hypothetical protein
VLSTSQTEFSGLGDAIPELVPWRVRLAGKGQSLGVYDIMYSREESSQANLARRRNLHLAQRPRSELFGVDPHPLFQHMEPTGMALGAATPSVFAQAQPFSAFGQATSSALDQKQHKSVPLFGSTGPREAATASSRGLFGNHEYDSSERDEDVDCMVKPKPDLGLEEPAFEETGLTITYDLPGVKSLSPSSSTSKQRVVRIAYSNAVFNHVVVAKHKRAAFLKTMLQNSSKLTLLGGHTSLTLDGSFLGRTALPRCSPGESFTLNLGVDPAIQVVYPKPEVKRSSSSVFSLSSSDSSLYTRTLTLVNTRSGAQAKVANIEVLDQVPVSEDEHLKIELLKPSGLVPDGHSVSAGESTEESHDQHPNSWGSAEAKLKKGGEVVWNVTLNPGRQTKLTLKYLCAVPSGDPATNV